MNLRLAFSLTAFLLLSILPAQALGAPGGTAWLPTDFTAQQLVPLNKAEKAAVWKEASGNLRTRLAKCEKRSAQAARTSCKAWARKAFRRGVEQGLQPLYWQGTEQNAPLAPMPPSEGGPPKYSTYVKFTPLWEACRTEITYSLEAELAPAQNRVRSDARKAFARMGEATGYSFREVPTGGEIRVVWDADMDRFLKGNADSFFAEDSPQTYRYDVVGGLIRINPKNDLSGESTKKLIGQYLRDELIFHELGHVMGLADIDDPRSVMKNLTSYSRADAMAFDAVGRSRCHR